MLCDYNRYYLQQVNRQQNFTLKIRKTIFRITITDTSLCEIRYFIALIHSTVVVSQHYTGKRVCITITRVYAALLTFFFFQQIHSEKEVITY